MATVANLITRVRGPLNEATARFWTDDEGDLLGAVNDGLLQTHAYMKGRLQGSAPDPGHEYWRDFYTETTLTVTAGAQEVNLPADYDILGYLEDNITGEEMYRYDRNKERVLKRGTTLGVGAGSGFYTFSDAKQIRVLTWPGAEGVPTGSNRTLNLGYFKAYSRHDLTSETVTMDERWTQAPVLYAIAQGLIKERESPVEIFQAHQAALELMP